MLDLYIVTDNPHRRLGLGMTIAMWVVVLFLLTLFFQDWWGKQQNPNQQLPVSFDANGAPELVLQRNRYGHYVASGAINGQPVVFMVDTGASDVSVPGDVAERLGLKPGRALVYQTANGPVRAYRTRLDEVSLGAIRLAGVRASINPAMQQQEVLLGMSFLKHLEFTQRGDTLTLRQLHSR
ncbi:MAG: TIGR02281 family clan AA aspartic protease [Gammaproteobacteria bacterium]|nr:TIGR02281 family clan AA aspartic protease [Gammaproteobacteria bacterium]